MPKRGGSVESPSLAHILHDIITRVPDVHDKVMSALYEIGTEGDFTRTGNAEADQVLEEVASDEDSAILAGEVSDDLKNMLGARRRRKSKKTRKAKKSVKKTRKMRR